MFPEKITKEEVNALPLIHFEGDIIVVDDKESAASAIKELKREKVLGFDTETKPTFRKGEYNHTALLQIAIPDKVYIFRLHMIGLLNSLKRIFEDRKIIKVGISIRDDLKDMKRLSSFQENSIVELNDVAALLGVLNQGVRNLSGIFLEGRISKGQQTSNWESPELSEKQLLYAATDAWVCLAIYQKLSFQGFI